MSDDDASVAGRRIAGVKRENVQRNTKVLDAAVSEGETNSSMNGRTKGD